MCFHVQNEIDLKYTAQLESICLLSLDYYLCIKSQLFRVEGGLSSFGMVQEIMQCISFNIIISGAIDLLTNGGRPRSCVCKSRKIIIIIPVITS